MLFTQTAEYALRAMARMAGAEPGARFRARDLSDETGIPLNYLSKILRRMVEAGLLDSRKGHGGGFRFARSPERIRFADVLHAVDFGFDDSTCVFGWGRCSAAEPCPLHPFWSELKQGFLAWAEAHTLADVRDGADPARFGSGEAGAG